MPDAATVTAFLASVKNATEIAKALKEVSSSLEKAEAKFEDRGAHGVIGGGKDGGG